MFAQASDFAKDIDLLFFYLTVVCSFFAALIFIFITFFAIKYRRKSEHERPEAIHGSWLLEVLWTAVPFLILMTMFVWGTNLFFTNLRPPADAMEIFVVAKQWMWKLQHPEGRREINELHVPVGKAVKLKMTSEDVIHSFYVPSFRIKMDVVPGRYTSTWFQASKPGKYHLFCAEYCGTKHAAMGGWVIVMEPEDYEEWLSGKSSASSSQSMEPLAVQGENSFRRLRCDTCHFSGSLVQGPDLKGLIGKEINLETGEKIIADEHYIRESILKPKAKVVAGYPAVMPTYQNQVTEEEIMAIIAYLKTLPVGEQI